MAVRERGDKPKTAPDTSGDSQGARGPASSCIPRTRTKESLMTTALLMSLLITPLAFERDAVAAEPQVQTQVQPEAVVKLGSNNVVRMRKLHIVRPELLPYPLAYDVYC